MQEKPLKNNKEKFMKIGIVKKIRIGKREKKLFKSTEDLEAVEEFVEWKCQL